MPVFTLAMKDLRLLLRDRRAMIILLAMPFLFILILGLSLGEGFGQKPDERLQILVVNLDRGPSDPVKGAVNGEKWSQVVLRDLAETAGIRVQTVASREAAEQMVSAGKRPAILVLGPDFSDKVAQCSFLKDGINPFYRDGVELHKIDVQVLRDPTQMAAGSIIEQVAQVSLLRVVLPWMIGKAFEKMGDKEFVALMRQEMGIKLNILNLDEKLGPGVQKALKLQFKNYDLTGKTWATLTKSKEHEVTVTPTQFLDEGGSGPLKRGALRYQTLVPSYTVMFAFFLVLTVGWLFVSERRQGTLKRLLLAPLSRTQILLGKMIPCFALSLAQGLILLGAGKLVFGMDWGAQPLWLLAVVFCTSLAAMGMALLIAALARTETQVAIYGTLLVLMLAGISGCLMPRALMPEDMKQLSLFTPHAWALDAYAQLLLSGTPNIEVVLTACGVLAAFGVGFVGLAWAVLRLE